MPLAPPWPKGVSGNPGGRPKGLALKMREAMLDGELIRDYLRRLIAGEERAKHSERLEAVKIALDRGWGKAVETSVQIALDSKTAQSLDFTDEQLAFLARLLLPGSSADPAPMVAPMVAEGQVIDSKPLESQDKVPTEPTDRVSVALSQDGGSDPPRPG